MAEEERGAGEGSTPPPPPPVLPPCRPPPPPPYPPTPRSPMAEEEYPPRHKRGPAISSGHGPPVPFQAQRAWAYLRRSLLSPSVAAAGLEEGHLSAGLRFLPPSEEEGPSSTSVVVAEEEGPPPPSSSFSPTEDDHPHWEERRWGWRWGGGEIGMPRDVEDLLVRVKNGSEPELGEVARPYPSPTRSRSRHRATATSPSSLSSVDGNGGDGSVCAARLSGGEVAVPSVLPLPPSNFPVRATAAAAAAAQSFVFRTDVDGKPGDP